MVNRLVIKQLLQNSTVFYNLPATAYVVTNTHVTAAYCRY